jgi:hypothetical protein
MRAYTAFRRADQAEIQSTAAEELAVHDKPASPRKAKPAWFDCACGSRSGVRAMGGETWSEIAQAAPRNRFPGVPSNRI